MLQSGTLVNIIDNTGAKKAACLKVLLGYRSRYAYVGDLIYVSVKTLRIKRRDSLKVKKGELFKALILRVKTKTFLHSGDSFFSIEMPCAVLLNKKDKFLGTRIFGSISKKFRYTKYLKVLSLSSGISV